MDDMELKQALRKMLQVELEAMEYYQQASRFMQDEGAIYHFNLLAQEELEHARTFHAVYPDDDLPPLDDLVRELPRDLSEQGLVDRELMARLTERHALQLAIHLEKEVAARLQTLLESIHSQAARTAIENNIESTLGHLELIRQDYQRLYGEVPSSGKIFPAE